MKRKILLGILIVLIGFGAIQYFTLSDLRSRYSVPVNDPNKVKELLAAMAEAHQTHLWNDLNSYEAAFSEEFYGFIGKIGNPFSEDHTLLSLKYLPATYTGQLKITNGDEQVPIWGINNGQTYTLEGGELAIEDDLTILFWLPTYQYFIEFPWRIQEATSFQYMGNHEINGQDCEGVLASWNTVEPQRNIDQYIIWISKESKRIVKIEYTIRDMYPFLTGAASFEDYKTFDGILLPTEFPVESNLVPNGLLHTMKILDFRSNVVKAAELEIF